MALGDQGNDGGDGGDRSDDPRLATGVPGPRRGAAGFDSSYQSTPPWDINRPQPAFVALAEAGEVRGRVLDIGCGTGEHALLAAGLGLEAVGVDAAPTAIAKAQEKAGQRGVTARFVVGDALDLRTSVPDLGFFDTVLDCGVFHVFEDHDRGPFAASLASVTAPGARYFLLCFSEHQPGDWGPRRVTQAEIRDTFTGDWRVDSIEPSRLVVTLLPDGVYAWRAALTRI
jgi:SAM-dependent methyltransferase